MILDSSAIVAIVLKEPGFEGLVEQLEGARLLAVGAPTLVETGIVLTARLGFDAQSILGRLLHDFDVVIVEFGEHHWHEAQGAYLRFGRGRHPAALNFGDCMSYAVARLAGRPLLFVGNDFPQTDVEVPRQPS